MDSKLEQRTCIKFCCKNEIKCSDTLKMLQKCYGDDTLSKTQMYQWYERFKSGREAVEDDAPGRPSTSKTDENVDEIRQLLIENRKLTIREIAETTNISFGSVQSILREDLGLILHDDNAPSHNALIIREFLVKNNTNTIQQPPNSPDLAPCDFFLFDRLKKPLRGTRFESVEAIKLKSLEALMAIPKTDFQKSFEGWIKRWHKCIAADGDYFEGDNLNFEE
ncbi:MOS1T transposase, partial [Acromyrmex heyeri]